MFFPDPVPQSKMIELAQIPWSPYCIVQRRILEFAGAKFKLVNVGNADRSLIWKWTKERYYQVPVIRDGKTVIFETDGDSQVIAKYLSEKFQLGLFPQELRGVQSVIWRHIENEIEDVGFRLNEIYWKESVPKKEQLAFLRHKERKFGRGCIDQWTGQKPQLLARLTALLAPFEQMLAVRPFLLDNRPRFVDFDLFGILGNFLYSGHYNLPAPHTGLEQWHERMAKVRFADLREKLRP
ncbi:MAG: glutathione S-transferase family protein [Verrucomicrobiota bacterium]